MLDLVAVGPLRVGRFGAWDEPPQRRFAAYRCRGDFRMLLGHSVIDEFGTLSSPVFFAPRGVAGAVYDAGLTLAHRRDPELDLDYGWPPLVVGLAAAAGELFGDWQERLLAALAAPARGHLDAADRHGERRAGDDLLQWARIGEADLFATTAPLLPKQLGRLCEASCRPVAVAVGTGRALVRSVEGRPQAVAVASEERLATLLAAAVALVEGS